MSHRFVTIARLVVLVLLVVFLPQAHAQTCQPPVSISAYPSEMCPSSTGYAWVDLPYGQPPYSSFEWSVVNGTFAEGSNHSSTLAFTATGNAPVEVTVSVTGEGGCTSSASATIGLKTITPQIRVGYSPAPQDTPNNAVVAPPAEGSYQSFQWSITGGTLETPAVDEFVQFHADGSGPVNLSVTVVDGEGCQGSDAVSIPLGVATPPIQVWYSPTCANGANNASVAPPPNGHQWVSYQWSITNGSFTSSNQTESMPFVANGSGPVTLTVALVDDQGNETSSTTTVPLQTSGPAISVWVPTACASGTNYASLVSEPGRTFTSYYWTVSNAQLNSWPYGSSAEFTPDGSGPVTLTVTVTESAGCTFVSNATLPLKTITAPPITVSPDPLPLQTTGSATAHVDDPANEHFTQVSWSATHGNAVGDMQDNHNATVYANGSGPVTLSYTARTTEGCTATMSRTFLVEGSSLMIDAPETFCSTQVAKTATLFPTSITNIQWTATNAEIVSGANSTSMSFRPTAFADVTLSATALDGNGNPLSASKVVRFVAPTTALTGKLYYDCPNYYNQLSVGNSYDFVNVTVTSSTNATVFVNGTSSISVRPLDRSVPLTVSILATTADGCTAAASATVNPLDDFKATVAFDPPAMCPGGTMHASVTNIKPNATYWWFLTGGAFDSESFNVTSVTFHATGAGPVQVRVQVRPNTHDCSAITDLTVPAGQTPTATVTASGPTTFCDGGSVTLTASNGASYLWSNGATTPSIDVSSSGNYSVAVTNASGCSATSSPTTVTVNPLPNATISASGPTTFCAGDSVTLTASAAASYLWSNGATTQSITASASGNYSVTTTNASGCSATSAPISVTAQPEVTGWLSVNETACIGSERSASAQAIAGGAYVDASYVWSISGGTITQNSGKNITFRAESDPLVLTVVMTDTNGCSFTKSRSVFVTSQPEPVITLSGPTTFCEGGYVTLTANEGSPFGGYLWSNGATTQSILVTESGSYSVTASGNECSATSQTVVVTVLPAPEVTITASGPTLFCEGGSVTLTASGGSSYLWSTGATTQSITVTGAGEYSVVGTNASGCSNNMGILVSTYPAPAATITPSGPTTFCAGGSVTLTANAGSSYLWSSGATTQSINVTSAGSYSVTVTNANGCNATSSPTTVTVNALPVATISASGPTTFCTGGSVTLTASAGSSYLWSNGATTPSINVISTGSYSVTVTNASGCNATSSPTTVTVNATPAATINASGPTTFCTGGSVTLTASAGASYLWSTGATTQSINVTSAGSYSVTVTNASGCSATSAPTSVVVNAKPATPTITASGPTAFCAGGSVTLTAPAGFTYLWSNGATSPSIVASAAGSYSVTVTNASGCSTSSAATSVTVNAATSISQQPQSKTIPKNTTTTLSVVASGTGTLTYQWFSGSSPSTATPIGGATGSSYTTPKLTRGTYRYWVRVTGSCGVANSATATITAN